MFTRIICNETRCLSNVQGCIKKPEDKEFPHICAEDEIKIIDGVVICEFKKDKSHDG